MLLRRSEPFEHALQAGEEDLRVLALEHQWRPNLQRIDVGTGGADQHVFLAQAIDHFCRSRGIGGPGRCGEIDAQVQPHAAHITDRRRRITHYVCEDGERALAIATEWAARYPQWGTKATLESDPGWAFRRTYGG